MRRFVAILTAVTACSTSYADDPPSRQFEHDVTARFHMHENYEVYTAIEHLLVHGKVDEVRDFARSIGIAPDEAGLSAWAAQAAVVRQRALALAAAPNLDEACRDAASLAEACASCHVDANALPEFRTPPALPADKPSVEARMTRHLWAIARVREGVLGAGDDVWNAGLAVLAEAPLPWPTEDANRTRGNSRGDLRRRGLLPRCDGVYHRAGTRRGRRP